MVAQMTSFFELCACSMSNHFSSEKRDFCVCYSRIEPKVLRNAGLGSSCSFQLGIGLCRGDRRSLSASFSKFGEFSTWILDRRPTTSESIFSHFFGCFPVASCVIQAYRWFLAFLDACFSTFRSPKDNFHKIVPTKKIRLLRTSG